MSSAKLTVKVYDGSRLVETISDRPVRLTPDGKAGVVYAGEVYPVYSDNSISLDARPTKKSLCYSFLTQGARVPYAGSRATAPTSSLISRWYLESNRFGHYIVFDAPKEVATDLVGRIRQAKIEVVRWDASVRPADDGELYDWFIRLGYDGTAEQCRQAVAPIVTGVAGDSSSNTSTLGATASATTNAIEIWLLRTERDVAVARNAELEQVADQFGELEKRASIAAAKAATLERQIAAMKDQHAAQLAAAVADAAVLRGQLAASRSERNEAEVFASNSERLDQVVAAKAAAEAEWLAAQEEAETMRSERDVLALKELTLLAELSSRDTLLQQLRDEATEVAAADRERRSRRSSGPQGGAYEDFLGRTLDRLELDPDDLELLLAWPSPRDAVQALLEINAGQRPPHSKAVRARQGWTEVAGINTGRKGSENLGRIYFRPMASSDRVRVCLHDKQDKKEQSRFMERLPDVE